MQTEAQEPASPAAEPETLRGDTDPRPTRRHHASLEYYLERFEAERIRESHLKGEHPTSKQAPPRHAARTAPTRSR